MRGILIALVASIPYLASAVVCERPLGYTSLTVECDELELKVRGKIPHWVTGTFIYNGPAYFQPGNEYFRTWFDGLAMLHGFTIQDGEVIYTNQFLKTSAYESKIEGKSTPYKGFFRTGEKALIPNANINVVSYPGAYVALTEVPLPVSFDLSSLDTTGLFQYSDALAKSQIWECAHPHRDPKTGEIINYFIQFQPSCKYVVYRLKPDSKAREVITEIAVEKPSYMHSFALTENYIILTEFPFFMDPVAKGDTSGFLSKFRWDKDVPLRFLVIKRNTGTLIGTYSGMPLFAWHHINSFEEDGSIYIDMAAYPDASVIASPEAEDPDQKGVARFVRYRISPDAELEHATAAVSKKVEKLFVGPSLEMPRINYDAYNTKPYNFVYGIDDISPMCKAKRRDLVKFNIKTSQRVVWSEAGCFAGEPVFIAKPGAIAEDDGVIVSVVLDTNAKRSFLLVLDAVRFKELARCYVPHHIPFGFHGNFFIK